MPQYCIPYPDLTNRYDTRRIAQFASDTGTPLLTPTQIAGIDGSAPTQAILNTNIKLVALAKDASNRILMACRVANRYLQSDLDAIYNSQFSTSDRSQALIELASHLMFGMLVSRRGLSLQEVSVQAPNYAAAEATLELLKRGDRVFDDSPPDGTDAPTAGVDTIITNSAANGAVAIAPTPVSVLWTVQTNNRIFPNSCGPYGGN